MKAVLFSATALALGVVAPAYAAPPTVSDLEKKLDALQDEVRGLKQQLQDEKAYDAKAAAETAAAQAAAKDASAAAAQAVKQAQATSQLVTDAPKVTQSPTGLFALSSADGRNTIAVTGRLHFDMGDYIGFKAANPVVGIGNPTTGYLASGVNARRARIGVTGKVAGDWTYTFIYDGGNSSDATAKGIESAIIGYTGFKSTILEAGYTDTLYTLDEAIGSNNIMFMERASPQVIATQFGAGDNRAEAGARYWDSNYWIGGYVTGPAIGVTHTLSAEQIAAFERATYQVIQTKEASLHIGADVLELFKAPNTGPGTARTLTLSDQPELRVDPTTFLNTGALGTVANPVTGGDVYSAELAGTFENFYGQGEYYHYVIDRFGRTNATFDGAYVQASYTFGGHRSYVPNTGAYSGVIPDKNFSLADGSTGAWEVGARVSRVNMTDQFAPGIALASQPLAVNGGRQDSYTVGVNWYINANMRWMFNYIHTLYKKENSTAATGAALGVPVGAQIDSLAARFQIAF